MLQHRQHSARTIPFSCLPETRLPAKRQVIRPANRWQQYKETSLSPRRSFSPNTNFELPYRTRSPILSSSSCEDDKARLDRSPAPSPIFGPTDLYSVGGSPRILDLGLSTPPREGFMDDFVTGIFMTLDENGDPIFPEDDDMADVDNDEAPIRQAQASRFLFLDDNGNFDVMDNKENIKVKDMNSESKEKGEKKLVLEGVGFGSAADLPGGYGAFMTKSDGKLVLRYD